MTGRAINEPERAIRSFFRRLRRTALLHALLVEGGQFLAAVLLLTLVLVVSSSVWSRQPALRIVFLGFACCALLLTLIAVFARIRRGLSTPALACQIGARLPDLRSDLLSTLELSHDAPAAYSTELCRALFRRTWQRLSHHTPSSFLSADPLRRPAALLAAAALAWAAAFIWAPLRLSEAVSGLSSVATSVSERRSLVSDLAVSYQYPAYTGLAERHVANSTGSLLAPPGTVVKLAGRALSARTPLQLVVQTQDESQPGKHAVVIDASGQLTVAFTLRESGSYHFATKSLIERARDPADHRIDIQPDGRPRVVLVGPEGIQVSPEEQLELAYNIEDDYGIASVRLAYRVDDGPVQHEQIRTDRSDRSIAGKHLWSLTDVELSAARRLSYWVEATDNDGVSGKKIGRSKKHELSFFNAHEQHRQTLEAHQQLLERFLGHLARRLLLLSQAPGANELHSIHRAHGQLVDRMTETVTLMQSDVLLPDVVRETIRMMRVRAAKDRRGERRLLKRYRKHNGGPLTKSSLRRFTRHNDQVIEHLESDTLLLADLLDEQRIDSVARLAERLKRQRNEMAKLLAEYRRTKDPQLRARLAAHVRALKARAAQLLQKLAKVGDQIPDEFLNVEAIKQMNVARSLSELQTLLEQGKFDEMDALLNQLDGQLAELDALMKEDLQEFRDARLHEREKAYAKLLSQLRGLEEQQRALANRTATLKERYQRRAADLLRKQVGPALREQLGKLRRLQRQLDQFEGSVLHSNQQDQLARGKQRAKWLEQGLADGDLDASLEVSRELNADLQLLADELEDLALAGSVDGVHPRLRRNLGRSHRAQQFAAEIETDLEAMLPSARSMLSRQDIAEMRRIERRQRRLERELKEVSKASQSEKAPFPSGLGQRMKQSSGLMEAARERLSDLKPGQAQSAQQAAAAELAQTQKDLLRGRKPRGAGQRHTRRDPIKIPDAERFKAPQQFREELMEAMKERPPEPYQRQVHQYYRELVR